MNAKLGAIVVAAFEPVDPTAGLFAALVDEKVRYDEESVVTGVTLVDSSFDLNIDDFAGVNIVLLSFVGRAADRLEENTDFVGVLGSGDDIFAFELSF